MKERENRTTYGPRITFRLSQKELERLDALLARSSCQSQSELIRKMLFKGKVKFVTHDKSLDMVMELLSAVRTELHAIGININQVTRRFHTETLPETRLLKALEIQELNKETGKKIEDLFEIINKLSERWLQE